MGFFNWITKRHNVDDMARMEKLSEEVEEEFYPKDNDVEQIKNDASISETKSQKMEFMMKNLGWSGKIVEKIR